MKIIIFLIILFLILTKINNILKSKNETKEWQEPLTKGWKQIQKEAKNRMIDTKENKLNRPKYWDNIDNNNVINNWIKGPESINNEWINFGLWVNGQPIIKNCQKCPNTFNLIKESINLGAKVKVAGFSWLKPKSKIPPHTDPNEDTVYHLGLIVPDKNNCYIETDNKKIIHQAGKWITFDDRKIHSAINNSNHDRVILYMLIE